MTRQTAADASDPPSRRRTVLLVFAAIARGAHALERHAARRPGRQRTAISATLLLLALFVGLLILAALRQS